MAVLRSRGQAVGLIFLLSTRESLRMPTSQTMSGQNVQRTGAILNGEAGSEVMPRPTRCPACGNPKDRKRFLCVACWRILPRDFRRRLFATRFKPQAHAKAISDAVAQILYGEPEPSLFDGEKRA